MIDPKELAGLVARGYVDIVAPLSEISGYAARNLIIAALRAYVPPCEHVWDDLGKGGRVWWWASDECLWKRRCVKCGIAEGYKSLVPKEELR